MIILIWIGLAIGFIIILFTVNLNEQVYPVRTPYGYAYVNGYAIIPIGVGMAVVVYFAFRDREPPKKDVMIIGEKC